MKKQLRHRADLDDDPAPMESDAKALKMPHCVRCNRDMPGYHALYGICQTCIEIEQESLKGLLQRIRPQQVNGGLHTKGDPHGQADRPAGDSGPPAGILTGESDEVPF